MNRETAVAAIRDSWDRVYRWARRISRRRKARLVAQFVEANGIDSVLFVGVGQGWEALDLVVEEAAADRVSTRLATDIHAKSAVPWPYMRADGLALPFRDGSFDLVLSNAVIEHVGDQDDQRRFVEEHQRVGRHWLITTPNRWFPFEPHTKAVLLHWVPVWRRDRDEVFTRLLSRRELAELLPDASVIHGRWWSPTFVATSGP